VTPVSSLHRGFSATTFVDPLLHQAGQQNAGPRECRTNLYRPADTMEMDVVDPPLVLVHYRAMDRPWRTVTSNMQYIVSKCTKFIYQSIDQSFNQSIGIFKVVKVVHYEKLVNCL